MTNCSLYAWNLDESLPFIIHLLFPFPRSAIFIIIKYQHLSQNCLHKKNWPFEVEEEAEFTVRLKG